MAGKSFSAQSFARLLQVLNEQLSDFDDAIASAVAEHPDSPIFASFPGIGPVLTAVLLAELGEDRARFPTRHLVVRGRACSRHPVVGAIEIGSIAMPPTGG